MNFELRKRRENVRLDAENNGNANYGHKLKLHLMDLLRICCIKHHTCRRSDSARIIAPLPKNTWDNLSAVEIRHISDICEFPLPWRRQSGEMAAWWIVLTTRYATAVDVSLYEISVFGRACVWHVKCTQTVSIKSSQSASNTNVTHPLQC